MIVLVVILTFLITSKRKKLLGCGRPFVSRLVFIPRSEVKAGIPLRTGFPFDVEKSRQVYATMTFPLETVLLINKLPFPFLSSLYTDV